MFETLQRLDAIGHWFSSWWDIVVSYGWAGVVVAACALIAWFAPGLKTKAAAIVVAGVIVLTTIAFGIGEHKGAARVKADWDWTLAAEVKEGGQAGDDAERTIDAQPPSGMSDDQWNRDRWTK